MFPAAIEPYAAIQTRLNRSGSDPAELVMLLMLIVAVAFGVGLYLWHARRPAAPKPEPGPGGLFDELAQAHGLTRPERELLLRAATGLPRPAEAFIDPTPLAALAAAHPADREPCERLTARLFGSAV